MKRKHSNRPTRRLMIVAILALAVAGVTAQFAAGQAAEPVVPAKIAVPAGNTLFLVGHATGVQIYQCDVTPAGFTWNFVAPRATLYDSRGRLLTTHFAGPAWRAKDGSTVVGRVVDRVTLYPTAIPWLLLSTASTTVGEDGDRLARTTYIQRLNTSGGLAPNAGCTARTFGATARVPYSADYLFWSATGV
jgi:hypothetical protein